MFKEHLSTLYDYNYWANQRILSCVAHLTASQFSDATSHTQHTAHEILVHTLGAEWIWRMRSQEGISPRELPTVEEWGTLQAIRTAWQSEEQKMQDFLAGLSDSDLKRAIHYRTTGGTQRATPLGQILHHVVLHGMQHRSEMAAILTHFGHSPGDIDFIVFLRSRE
ncbi:MAG: DinB family protein [Ardenticatenaceae bacterium]